jgi:hypothetical protein
MRKESEARTMKSLRRMASTIQRGLNKAEKVNSLGLPDGLMPMNKILKPGVRGDAKVEFYEVTQGGANLHNLRQAIHGTPEMAISPGMYTKLIVGGELMMSDAPYEARSNTDIIRMARGKVLIAGLGLGMILVPILRKRNVSHVTIVEQSAGVIHLVEPGLERWWNHQATIGAHPAPFEVSCGDIFKWVPPEKAKYDTIYFDIWPTICTDNLKEIATLKRRFGKYRKPDAWMGAWVEKELRTLKRRER